MKHDEFFHLWHQSKTADVQPELVELQSIDVYLQK